MTNANRVGIAPPDPKDFTLRGARKLGMAVYRFAQQSLNLMRHQYGLELVPDGVPISDEIVAAMVEADDEFIRDLGRFLELSSKQDFLAADELYRDWYARANADHRRNRQSKLASIATAHKIRQADERRKKAIELANVKRARRPKRSNRAIAMEVSRELGISFETARKYLIGSKPKSG